MGGWNKNLTKETDERVKKNGVSISETKKYFGVVGNKGTKNNWWKGGKIDKWCPICNSLFLIYPSQEKIIKTCNRKCGNILRGVGVRKRQTGITKDMSDRVMRSANTRRGVKFSEAVHKKISNSMKLLWGKEEYRKKQLEKGWFSCHNNRECYYKKIPMRSSWEVRFGRWLDERRYWWRYEPGMFKLTNGQYYMPDFWVEDLNSYIEIKGKRERMDKCVDFAQRHPLLILEYHDLIKLGVL